MQTIRIEKQNDDWSPLVEAIVQKDIEPNDWHN